MEWFDQEYWKEVMEAWYGVPALKRQGEELDRKLAEFENNMGFFGSGDRSGGYDISPTPAPTPPEKQLKVTRPATAGATAKVKTPVKIGSLPTVPAWAWHVMLAIAAAGIVHVAIYFYGR